MKTPHKHAEIIKAWADGAEIEVFYYTKNCWEPEDEPNWDADAKFRIKSEPKPNVIMYCNPAIEDIGYLTCAQWECDNLKLTFDGETNKLIKAEVI